jgi:succinoglycan biosynthesis transport protein ExoP
MLNVSQPKQSEAQFTSSSPSDGDSPIDFYLILGFLRRQWAPIVTAMALTVIAAIIYCLSATPKYTAAALVLVDPANVRSLHDQPGNVDSPTAATIDSQIEICKSERVLLRVVKQLALESDPEFTTSHTSFLNRVWRFLVSSRGSSGISVQVPLPNQVIVELIRNGLEVKRVGFANVIEIKYTAEQPEKAARIANAVADAYLADTLDAKYEIMQRAGGWFRDRLKELSRQATAAEAAVQEFKAKNNIIDTDQGLMNERQLAEISSQIIVARAQVAEAKARWERAEEILRGDPRSAAVTDSLRNEVMGKRSSGTLTTTA